MNTQSFDAKTRAKVEELLGERGKKDNRAVRFRDIPGISATANLAEVRKTAEKVARDIAEGYDGANLDLSQLLDEIDQAKQAAVQAAVDATNAQNAVAAMEMYADNAVADAKAAMAVDYSSAMAAAEAALEHADEAKSSLMEVHAGVSRLFPSDMRGGGAYWQHALDGAPTATSAFPSQVQFFEDGTEGDFIRLPSGQSGVLRVLSRAVSEYISGKWIRVTVRVRSLGGATDRLGLMFSTLRADWTYHRVLAGGNFTTSASGQWATIVQEYNLPAAQALETHFRAGVRAIHNAGADLTVDVSMIRIEDVTLLRETDGLRAQAVVARNDAIVAKNSAEGAESAAKTSETIAVQAAADAATARGQAQNSASAAASSATTAGTKATEAGSSAVVANNARLAAEAARNDASGASSAASVARDQAVVARQDAESAAASASESLSLTAEVAGRGISVLNDQFLVSSDWARWTGGGTLLVVPNEVYPIGRTWGFTVSATQQDGVYINDSPDSIWTGQVNAAAYVVEIELSWAGSSLNGAGVVFRWASTAASYDVRKTFSEMLSGGRQTGKTQLARAVFRRPPGFTGTFHSHDLYVMANYSGSGWPLAAKTIKIHRVNIRPATDEELGSGEVEAGVRANILVDYFTRTETNQAIAEFDMSLNASLGGMRASVSQSATALSTLQGRVARTRNMVTVDGVRYAGLEAVAFDGLGAGTGTALMLYGDQVIVPNSLSARQVVVHDGSGNLIVNGDFRYGDTSGWTNVNPAFNVIPRDPQSGNSAVRNSPTEYLLSVPINGTDRYIRAVENVDCKEGDRFSCSIDIAGGGTGINLTWQLIFQFVNDTGSQIGSAHTRQVSTTSAAWTSSNFAEVVAPAGTKKLAAVRLRLAGTSTGNTAFATNVEVLKKRSAATLISPGSVYSPLIAGQQIKGEHVDAGSFAAYGLAIFGGTLRSDNFNLANGTGWRITQNGTMNMPNAIVDSAHIKNAAIKSANIGDLEVGRLKVADGSMSVTESAYTAGNIDISGSLTTVQTLTYTPGRIGRQILDVHVNVVIGNGTLHIRLVANGSTVGRTLAITDIGGQTFRIADTVNRNSAVTYEVVMYCDMGTARVSQRLIQTVNNHK